MSIKTKKAKYVIFGAALGLVFIALWACPGTTTEYVTTSAWKDIGEDPPLDQSVGGLDDKSSYAGDEEAMAMRYRYRYGSWEITESQGGSKVYYSKTISPQALAKVYEALGSPVPQSAIDAEKVAVKLNMGENVSVNRFYIDPALIGDFVKSLKGTPVDSTTFYDIQLNLGNALIGMPPGLVAKTRGEKSLYEAVAAANGFTVANMGKAVHILNDGYTGITDADDVKIPISNSKYGLTHALLGKGINDYDWIVSIAHFKGHGDAGFGGTFKNLAIGIASYYGKKDIHQNGGAEEWFFTTTFEPFQEKIVEYNQALMQNSRFKDKLVYINVLNNLSRQCDCLGDAAPAPELRDIGILASADPVALEKASVDLIYKLADDPNETVADRLGAAHLVRTFEAHRGNHQIRHAVRLGLGNPFYELVDVQ
ncbi:MAG: DUF362 domain-containing protein [Treponema sp.]|jgi:uncharacterized Fe-S center protein|nr:DUF362 domain-containing protein [Treponema sp.]